MLAATVAAAGLVQGGVLQIRRPWRWWVGLPLASRLGALAVRTLVGRVLGATPWPVSPNHLLCAAGLFALSTVPLQRAVSIGRIWLGLWCLLLLAFVQYVGASVLLGSGARFLHPALVMAAALADLALGAWVVGRLLVPVVLFVPLHPLRGGGRQRALWQVRQACWSVCVGVAPAVLLPQIALLLWFAPD